MPEPTEKKNYAVQCTGCRKQFDLMIAPADVEAWHKGALIQRVMPYLDKAERELLISGTCAACWEKLFANEEE